MKGEIIVKHVNHQSYIPHNRLTLGMGEEEAAKKVLQSGWVAQGKEVELFENEFCDFLHIPRGSAVALSSGTAGLYLALHYLNAKGKNIAIPMFTCSALRNATIFAGGNPILIDSSFHTPNVNILEMDKSTEIAIVPHMYGIPQDISSMKGIVIEDCAQSLGALVNGVSVGLQGDVGVYSFYATKLITSGGQGGMVVSKNRMIIECMKDFRQYDGRMDLKPRFNVQMTDLQAAIGRVQLKKLSQFMHRRSSIYNQYKAVGLPLLDGMKNVNPVHYRALLQTNKQK